MRKFHLEPSPCSSTGLQCIRANDLSEFECRYIRGVVTNNYMPSDDYKLGRAAGVFLQSFQLPFNEDSDGHVMVEFWSRDTIAMEKFIVHIEEGINEHP